MEIWIFERIQLKKVKRDEGNLKHTFRLLRIQNSDLYTEDSRLYPKILKSRLSFKTCVNEKLVLVRGQQNEGVKFNQICMSSQNKFSRIFRVLTGYN